MQYTIKDILSYNNPCLQCGTGTILKLWSQHQTLSLSEVITYSMKDNSKSSIEFTLKYTYNYSLVLTINCNNNEYNSRTIYHTTYAVKSGFMEDFQAFLLNNNLRLRMVCNKCSGWSEFSNLKFNNRIIGPVSLTRESLYLQSEDGTQFYLSTFMDQDITDIFYQKIEAKEQMILNHGDMWWPTNFNHIRLPAIPRSLFKGKVEMLNALQTYIMLS